MIIQSTLRYRVFIMTWQVIKPAMLPQVPCKSKGQYLFSLLVFIGCSNDRQQIGMCVQVVVMFIDSFIYDVAYVRNVEVCMQSMICYIPGCICYGTENFGLVCLNDDYVWLAGATHSSIQQLHIGLITALQLNNLFSIDRWVFFYYQPVYLFCFLSRFVFILWRTVKLCMCRLKLTFDRVQDCTLELITEAVVTVRHASFWKIVRRRKKSTILQEDLKRKKKEKKKKKCCPVFWHLLHTVTPCNGAEAAQGRCSAAMHNITEMDRLHEKHELQYSPVRTPEEYLVSYFHVRFRNENLKKNSSFLRAFATRRCRIALISVPYSSVLVYPCEQLEKRQTVFLK